MMIPSPLSRLSRRFPVSEARFAVGYGGRSVEDGRMSVRQLAPALLAIGDLIEESNNILNGDAAQVTVRIRPATRPGSVIIDLDMVLGLSEQLSALADPDRITDAEQLLALLGFLDPGGKVLGNIKNVLEYIKALAGGAFRSSTTLEDGSTQITIERNDGVVENHTVNNNNIVILGNNRNVREALSEFVGRQLSNPGIDEFQVRDPEDEERIIDRVTKDESEYFRALPEGEEEPEEIQEGEFEDWVTVRKSWVVQPDRKWQFANSQGAPFNAVVEDERFWERIERDEVHITRHGKFRVRVEWRQEGESEPEYRVAEVLDERHGRGPGPRGHRLQRR